MTVFELVAKILLDTSEYEDKLKESRKNTSQFADKLKSGLKTAAKVGAAAMTAAGTAIVGLGKIGLDYNSQMEQYTTNFTTMLGSQEAAIAKVEELKEFAAKTPFEMSGLASATQTLLSFGIEADDTMGIMKMLGDVSLGDSQKFDSLALVFGQVSSQGKLMGQDLLQMINSGFNPLQIISEHTGESMASLKDRMSEGEITIEDVTQAFQWATEEGGKFYNGMEAGSKTTQGLISTLKDNIQAKLGEAFQTVSDKLKELLPQAIEFVDSINVESVVETVQNLINVFVNLAPVIAAATTAIVAYKAAVAFTALVDAAVKSVKAFQAANEGATVAQALLNTTILANPFALIISIIAAVVVAIGTLWATNEDFRNAVKGIWEDIKNAFSSAWDAIKSVWDAVPGFFSGIWSSIKGVFSVVASVLGGFFSAAWSAITGVWNAAKGFFGGIWSGIRSTFSSVASTLGGFFSSAWNSIRNAWSSVTSFFSGIWSSIKGVFSGAASSFMSIGRNVVNGLKNGIANAWGALTGWVKSKFSGLVSGVKSLLGIASPSKVFASIGGYMAEGVGVGWDKAYGDVKKLIDNDMDFSGNVSASGTGNPGYQPIGPSLSGAPVININVNGANIQNDQELAERIAFEMQRIFDRKAAVFGT